MVATHREPVTRRVLLLGSAVVAGGALTACGALADEALPGTLSNIDVLPAPVRDRLGEAMRAAIAAAPPGAPFGAVLVDAATGAVVAAAGNETVTGDPSAHAEVDVMRKAGLAGVDLTSTVLVTTAESCAMCAACAVWAGVQSVVYGTSIAFLADSGWEQFRLTQPQIVAASWLTQPIIGGYLSELTDPLYASGPPA